MLSLALLGDFLIAKDQVQEWPLPLARLGWAPCGGSPSGDQAAAALPRAPSVAPSMGPCPTELWGSGFIELALLAWCQCWLVGARQEANMPCTVCLMGAPLPVPLSLLTQPGSRGVPLDVDVTFPLRVGSILQTLGRAPAQAAPH